MHEIEADKAPARLVIITINPLLTSRDPRTPEHL